MSYNHIELAKFLIASGAAVNLGTKRYRAVALAGSDAICGCAYLTLTLFTNGVGQATMTWIRRCIGARRSSAPSCCWSTVRS